MEEVTDKLVNQMYRFAGVSKDKMLQTLLSLDPKKCLEKPYDKKWTKENPLYGYSYYIAEFLYYYVAPKGSLCKRLWYAQSRGGTLQQYLWFIQWPDGTLIDLTVAQFKEVPNYSLAKPAKFKSKTNKPLLTTKKIAEALGYSDEDLD